MNNKRNTIIGVLLLLVVMTIGYALFSETVTIGGTAKADGNLSLDFYNPDGTNGLDIKVNGVGSSGTAKIDKSRKKLDVTVNFDYPTAYAEIPVKVKNTGNIDLYVEEINLNGTMTIQYSTGTTATFNNKEILNLLLNYTGINKYDLIKKNEEKIITLKTNWLDELSGGNSGTLQNIKFTLSITAVQEINDDNTGVPTSPYKYAIGDVISIGTEKFNVINEDAHSVTMLAQNNLTLDGKKQDSVLHPVAFADEKLDKKPNKSYGYWTDDNGYLLPKYGGDPSKQDEEYGYEANIYDENSKLYSIVETYVSELRRIKNVPKVDEKLISGRLIYASEFYDLKISDNYTWIGNGQDFWAGSAYREGYVKYIDSDGMYDSSMRFSESSHMGVRPVIIIDKKYL